MLYPSQERPLVLQISPTEGDDVIPIHAKPLNYPLSALKLLQEGQEAAARGEVPCRVYRTEFTNCVSDEEFLAKLYCVRQALSDVSTRVRNAPFANKCDLQMTSDEQRRMWLIDTGRRLIAALLRQACKETNGFYETYDTLIDYVLERDRWAAIEEELLQRRVPAVRSVFSVISNASSCADQSLRHCARLYPNGCF